MAVYHGPKNISGDRVVEALARLGLPHVRIGARAIATGRLEDCACVVFPGGHSIRIGARAERKLKHWLRLGGGFVGLCAGCQFGVALGLLPVRHVILRAAGIFDLRLVRPHAITAGYRVAGRHLNRARWVYSSQGRVRMRYANGGLLLPAHPRARVVVSFDEAGAWGAVVAGGYGRGRVVLISPHPESTPNAPALRRADADFSQDPLVLFGNAVRFASRRRIVRRPPH